jgi:hypothetical protein
MMKNRINFQDLAKKNRASNQKIPAYDCCEYSKEAIATMRGEIGEVFKQLFHFWYLKLP